MCVSQNSFPHLRPKFSSLRNPIDTVYAPVLVRQRFPTTWLRAIIIACLQLPMFSRHNLIRHNRRINSGSPHYCLPISFKRLTLSQPRIQSHHRGQRLCFIHPFLEPRFHRLLLYLLHLSVRIVQVTIQLQQSNHVFIADGTRESLCGGLAFIFGAGERELVERL